MKLCRISALLLVVGNCLGIVPMAAAQEQKNSGRTIWDGVYSAGQAERGKAAYLRHCGQCHNEDLSGYQAILKGDRFMTQWREASLENFYNTVRTTMPRDVPGSLSVDLYLDITAYVLLVNGMPAGASDLTRDALGSIQVQGKDGPQEVPTGALVEVVGCLGQGPASAWTLTHATRPVRTKNPAESTAEELKVWEAKPLGAQTFELMSAYGVEPKKGHKVEVKGLFVKNPGGDRINITTIQSTGSECGS